MFARTFSMSVIAVFTKIVATTLWTRWIENKSMFGQADY
jgi:hypothetical protein